MIESCCVDLGKRAALQELLNDMIKAREPERLVQVEAIQEQVTRYNGARAGKDNDTLKEVGLSLKQLVGKYMADVGQDEEDGLAPDMAQTWKDQVYEILRGAPHFPDGATWGEPVHIASTAPAAPAALDQAGDQASSSHYGGCDERNPGPQRDHADGPRQEPGNSKKEIMALSRSLIVGQSASVATEATRLADEAGEAIKSSREAIRAALRGMGVASDISEASGPNRAARRHPPTRPAGGESGTGVDSIRLGVRPHPGHCDVAPSRFQAET